jgi:hypothetical protein
MDHILFWCVCSRYVWVVLKETFGWSHTPVSVKDSVEGWCGVNNIGDSNKLFLFGLGAVC